MAIKILIGGSPCTYWSIAQKNNRETEASGMGWELFKNYLITKEKFKPDLFLYENNKSASQAIKDQIAKELGVGVDPDVRFTYINSALVSAQNRQRFYVTNFGDIEQPEDRGILLKDILETGTIDKDKAYCLKHQAGNIRDYFKKHHTQIACEPVYIGAVPENNGTYLNGKQPSQQYRIYDSNAKGVAVTTAAITNVAEPVCITNEMIPPCGQRNQDKARTITAGYQTCSARDLRMDIETDGFMGKQGVIEAVAEPLAINTADGGNKSRTIMAGYYKYGTATLLTNDGFKGGTTAVSEPVRVGTYPNSAKNQAHDSQQYRIYDVNAKAVTQCGNGGGMGAKTGLYAIPLETDIVPFVENKLDKAVEKYGYIPEMWNPYNAEITDKAPTQTANCASQTKSSTVLMTSPIYFAEPCEWDEEGKPIKAISFADGKTYTVYEVKDGQITIKGKQYPIKLVDGYYIIRKLTVRECARLQTMPDDYCKAVSDSQAYKALGNGWTAEVIIHLLNHALKDVPRDEEIIVLSMYDGIATGRYCLDKMGFTNVTYHAYEIDKYPIMVAMDNYPDIIQHGDAFAVREDGWKPPQTRSEWLDELLRGEI